MLGTAVFDKLGEYNCQEDETVVLLKTSTLRQDYAQEQREAGRREGAEAMRQRLREHLTEFRRTLAKESQKVENAFLETKLDAVLADDQED